MAGKVQFRRGLAGGGGYEVLLDGEIIGAVWEWERSYNLRRLIVSRGWRAKTISGERLYHEHGSTARTRAEAAEAVVSAYREEVGR